MDPAGVWRVPDHDRVAWGGRRDEPARARRRDRFGGTHLLVGANGSGKSTLLNLAAGVLAPDSGRIAIDGRTGGDAKSLAFLAPPDALAIPWLTGRRFIAFAAALFPGYHGEGAIAPVARHLGLEPFLETTLGAMSSGTARKVLLVAAWISGAPVLLLDEPANELDQRSLEAFVDLLATPTVLALERASRPVS